MSPALFCRVGLGFVLGSLLAGCASNVPKVLREELPQAPTARAVQTEPERYLGQEVRWGGEILGLHNQASSTEVEIYARPLLRDSEPRPDGGEGVRFIARLKGFVDPAEYSPGKRLSVRGRLGEAVTRPVGEYAYRYPVVEVDVYQLWEAYRPAPEPAWYRDPYYDPWWPWGPWGPYRHWPYW